MTSRRASRGFDARQTTMMREKASTSKATLATKGNV
jgi:hypothetical protein